MKLFVTVQGQEFEVEVIEQDGRQVLMVDGQEMEVEFRTADSFGQVILMHAGKSYGLSVEGDPHLAHVTLAGHHYELHMEDERERAASLAAKAALGGGGPLEAVMPGIVVEVLVEEGQTVAAGEPLLILEAMKMQNEIVAPGDGSIESIKVKAGDTVPAGEVLFVLRGSES